MRKCLILFLIITSFAVARGDQKIADAQQSLKDQGFYYGDVNGEKNTETSDAVRRYQIRNGLSVTGELDDQTVQAIRKAAVAPEESTPSASATPASSNAKPVTPPEADDDRVESPPATQEIEHPSAAPARPPDAVYEGGTVAEGSNTFARTPYETSPPAVQRKVIMDAQRILSERGLFRYPVDGLFSPNLGFSLRAYQTRVGLRPSGRLDLETLAALELLPGSHRTAVPRPRVVPREPPVRGEWIRP